jgi:hypothetical protein
MEFLYSNFSDDVVPGFSNRIKLLAPIKVDDVEVEQQAKTSWCALCPEG